MIQYTMLWGGEDVKNVGNSKKDGGVGTIYQNKAELIAAAYPQPWELRPFRNRCIDFSIGTTTMIRQATATSTTIPPPLITLPT